MASDELNRFDITGEPNQSSNLQDFKNDLTLKIDKLAGMWFRAIQYSGYVSLSFQELYAQIHLLSRQVFAFLLKNPELPEPGPTLNPAEIGHKLATLHLLRPESFHASLEAIRNSVITILDQSHLQDELRLQLYTRLSLLLVEIAKGYYAAAVDTVQKEQEQVLQAVKLALEKAQGERMVLEKRNELLIHSLPDIMFFFDRNGTYLDYYTNNPELLTVPVEQFLHKNVREVFNPADAENITRMIQLCFDSGEAKDYVFSFETPSGIEYRETRFIPYAADQVLCLVRNVTRQKKAEEALISNEARYRAVVEDQTELICRWTKDGQLTFANQAFLRYFDLDRDQVVNEVFLPPVISADGEPKNDFLSWLVLCSTNDLPLTVEHRTVRSNGKIHWLEWNMRAISDINSHSGEIQAVGRDITKLKDFKERIEQANHLLRLLNQQLITTQEQERQAIALNLHDLVLNQLGGIIATTEASISAVELEVRLGKLIGQLREMISDLRPPMLNFGLYTGILGLLDEVRDRSQNTIETELQVNPSTDRLDPNIELHLFRILQQACHNTLQHAYAKWICISGAISEERVSLEVKDDGRGFSFGQDPDLSELLKHHHFGLVGMVERALMIGAEVHFANRIDEDGELKGARVLIEWIHKDLPAQGNSLLDTISDLPEDFGLLENQSLVSNQSATVLFDQYPKNEEPDS